MSTRTPQEQDPHQERLRQQTTLARFGEFALTSEDLDGILTEACRLVGEALGTDLAKVVELQPDGRTLLVRAGVGWKPGVVGEVRLELDENSSEGHAVATGEPVVSADITAQARFRYPAFLAEHGVRAIINVPIIGARARPPFGILQVDSRETRRFTEEDIGFLRGYANLLAAAVERLRVLGELREEKNALERRAAALERQRAEAALNQAHRMTTVVEHLPIGAALVGPSGQILIANPEFQRLLPGPVLPSTDEEGGEDWIALGPDGQRLEPSDYPGARALRGEVALNTDFLRRSGGGRERWLRVSGVPVRSLDGEVVAALVVLVDVDGEKRAAERQTLLTREVNHRAKNVLAVVQAALRLTRADDVASFVRSVEGRVAALARAQALLVADRWAGADLQALLHGELSAFLDRADRPSMGPVAELRGLPLMLPAKAAQPFSMAIHELATNAIKHGALSTPSGRLSVSWEIERHPGDLLRLRWTETGGPELMEQPRQGFGMRVLNGTLQDQIGGRVGMDWRPTGLVCNIELPLDRPTPGPGALAGPAAAHEAASGPALR